MIGKLWTALSDSIGSKTVTNCKKCTKFPTGANQQKLVPASEKQVELGFLVSAFYIHTRNHRC